MITIKENNLVAFKYILVGIIVLILLSIGSLLRFNKLDAWGFWEDEYLTQERAHLDAAQILNHNVTSRTLAFHSINSLNGWTIKKNVMSPYLMKGSCDGLWLWQVSLAYWQYSWLSEKCPAISPD